MQTYNEAQARANVEEVEALVDQFTLFGLLEILSSVCSEKAEHIRTNWQDDPRLAKDWDAAAKKLDALTSKVAGL